MQRPPRTPKPASGVPIINAGPKYAEKFRFDVGRFQVHPPASFDQMYVLALCMMVGTDAQRAIMREMGVSLNVYAAEDYTADGLVAQGEMMLLELDPEYDFVFVVPKSAPEDDSEKRRC